MNPKQKINKAIDLAEQGQTEQAIKMLQTIQHPRDDNAQTGLSCWLFKEQDEQKEAKLAQKHRIQ